MARDISTRYSLRKQDRPDYFLPDEASSDEQEDSTATSAEEQPGLADPTRVPKKRVIAEDSVPAAPEQKKQQHGPSAGERQPTRLAPVTKRKEPSRAQTTASKKACGTTASLTMKDFIEDDGWDWADEPYRPSSSSTISKPTIRPRARMSVVKPFLKPKGVPSKTHNIKVSADQSTPASASASRPAWAVATPTSAGPTDPLPTAPTPCTAPLASNVAAPINPPVSSSNIQAPTLSIAKADFRKTIDEVLPPLKSARYDRAVQLIESLSAVVTYDMQLRRNFEAASIADKQMISDLQSRNQALERHIKDKDLDLETRLSSWTTKATEREEAVNSLKQELDTVKKRSVSQNLQILSLVEDKRNANDRSKAVEARLEAYKMAAEEEQKRLQQVIKEKEADLAYWTKM